MRPGISYLLAGSLVVCTQLAQAVSFLSFDARTMALGGSGAASARPDQAAIFNPALLHAESLQREGFRYFGHTYLGARVLDRDNFIDSAESFDEQNYEARLDEALDTLHLAFEGGDLSPYELRIVTTQARDILQHFAGLSAKPLRLGVSAGISLAHQRSEFSWGIYHREFRVIGAEIQIVDTDLDRIYQVLNTADALADVMESAATIDALLERSEFDEIIELAQRDIDNGHVSDELRAYQDIPVVNELVMAIEEFGTDIIELEQYINIEALYEAVVAQVGDDVDELEDISIRDYLRYQIPEQFESRVAYSGAEITETALSFASTWPRNRALRFGLSLKQQKIAAIGYYQALDEVDINAYQDEQHRIYYQRINVDVGLAYTLSERWTSALTVKNLVPYTLLTPIGTEVVIEPIARAALAYKMPSWLWTLDYDLTRNEALGFDPDKQYLTTGLEWFVWKTTALRLGYRYNIVDHSAVPALGFGLGFDHGHLDFGVTISDAYDEVGAALQFGLRF